MKFTQGFIYVFNILAIFWACAFSYGQVTMEEFLHSATADYEVSTFNDQMDWLKRKNYALPPLRQVQLRFQNRELLDTQNEFSLRISPANPWEMKATDRYYQNVRSSLGFEKELALREALFLRYLTVAEYKYRMELNALSIAGQESLNRQLAILQEQSGSRNFDADEYAELQLEQLDYEASQREYEYEISNQISSMMRLYPQASGRSIHWAPEEMISVERIRQVVDSLTAVSARSTLVAFSQQQINIARSQYALERSNINIGFGQIEYDFRRYHQDRTPINFGFGVTLPIANPNKPDMARRKLQLIEAEYDLKEAEVETGVDLVIYQEKLTRLIGSYDVLRKRIEELETSDFAQTLSSINGGDPFLYVQFNERVSRLGKVLIQLRNDIVVTYIEYLTFSDRIQQQPLVNYLSPNLRPLSAE